MKHLLWVSFAFLLLGAPGFAQRGRACKLPVIDHLSGCILCGIYQTNGYCTCKIDIPCSDAPGADVMELIGDCVPSGGYCGFTATQSKTIAATNQVKYAYWLKSTSLPSLLEANHPIVKRALEAVQDGLLKDDVIGCAWDADAFAIRNKANFDDPIYVEVKHMGNSYKLSVMFWSDKQPRWILHLFPNGWSLEDGAKVNLANGSYE